MKKPWYKRVWVWIVIILVVFFISALNSDDTTEQDTATENAESENTTNEEGVGETEEPAEEEPAEAEEPKEETPQQKMFNQIVSLMDEGLTFDTGDYVKGDIPKGEYAFVTFDGSGQYYSEEDSAGNIIDNENFSSFGYVYVHEAGNIKTQGVLVSLEAFDDLGVTGAKQIYETLNNLENYKEAGMYKIGTDLPAGQYTIESFGEGYVAILSGPVGNNEIVDNEIFNGNYGVSVSDGQFLQVNKGAITE